jgi:hypothetical protein
LVIVRNLLVDNSRVSPGFLQWFVNFKTQPICGPSIKCSASWLDLQTVGMPSKTR